MVHAITIVVCVRNVERSMAGELSLSDVDERFSELQQAIHDCTETFDGALARRGISLADLAQLTKVSIRDLKVLRKGDLSRISLGFQSIFSFMPELSKLLNSQSSSGGEICLRD